MRLKFGTITVYVAKNATVHALLSLKIQNIFNIKNDKQEDKKGYSSQLNCLKQYADTKIAVLIAH